MLPTASVPTARTVPGTTKTVPSTPSSTLYQTQIRRIMELQLRVVALIGTALLSLLVGVANFISRLLYDDMYAVDSSGGTAGAS